MTLLSVRPLTGVFIEEVENRIGPVANRVTVGELKNLSPYKLLLKLRSIKGSALYIAFEDPNSVALLPLLKALATLTKVAKIYIISPDLVAERFFRTNVIGALYDFTFACFAIRLSAFLCRREMTNLKTEQRIVPVSVTKGKIAYINTDFWFGPKTGGSIGHIAGVVNGFFGKGYSVDYLSASDPVMINPSVNYIKIDRPTAFGTPTELNQYRFHHLFVAHAKTSLKGKYSFIYQRLSLGNYTGVALSRARKIPFIFEYNGSEAWVANNWGIRPLDYYDLAIAAEEVCLRHAHLIVTVSQTLTDELVERGVERERIVSYPNCVDPDLFNPARYTGEDKTALRKKHGISDDDVVVTFIGTFGLWHGAETLAKAIASLVEGKKNLIRKARFLFVGDGQRMPEVKKILEGAPVDCVTFTGLTPQHTAPGYLAISDICVSPHVPNPDGSRFFGSPTKLYEYMIMGKAVVASDLEQIGDTLKEGVRVIDNPDIDSATAILSKPGDEKELADAILFLLESEERRDRIGANARRLALENYTWDKHVGAILSAFENSP